MKNLVILGSTGSIGRNALNIVEMFPDRFAVKALSAGRNTGLLAEQIRRFSPDLAAVLDEDSASELKTMLPSKGRPKVLSGEEGYKAAAEFAPADMVVSAMVGSAGLMPTLAAIKAGRDIALANKETLVTAGKIVMKTAEKTGASILPVDSEHSAVFQCLQGQRKEDLSTILLTASGGPFLNLPKDKFASVTPEDALNHPNWDMGQKITIDSATLMNKGLEVIEASHLFGVSRDRIEVVIHPQSIVHSMVSFRDGSVMAQLGMPDMKGAIAYALSYPERLSLNNHAPDFFDLKALTFEKPDLEKFPCLDLACRACEAGGTLPAVLNAANEIVVQAFLDRRITFEKIPVLINTAMERHTTVTDPSLSDIQAADAWAREETEGLIGE